MDSSNIFWWWSIVSEADFYMNLPFDLSGSRSKNRFRNEILWGLKRMLELYKENDEFIVVFDYVCDVEVHKEDGLEFYQVKTQNNDGAYTVDKLINKNKTGNSVFGKLYKLKFNTHGDERDEIKVSLVSNAAFNDGKKTHNNVEIIDFNMVDTPAQSKIKKSVKEELKLKEEIKLKNASFIKTSMDLINPHTTLVGETAIFFQEAFNCEPKKINALYRLLSSEVTNKASFELKLPTYAEVLEKKGVSSSFLKDVLSKYTEYTDNATIKAKDFISREYESDFRMRLKLNRALSQIVAHLHEGRQLQNMEKEIVNYIKGNLESLPNTDTEIIEEVSKYVHVQKPIEISNEEVQALVLLVLKRFEEGYVGYE